MSFKALASSRFSLDNPEGMQKCAQIGVQTIVFAMLSAVHLNGFDNVLYTRIHSVRFYSAHMDTATVRLRFMHAQEHTYRVL